MTELMKWRGRVTLNLDIQAEDDDNAIEAITEHVAPILSSSCSIAERRVVLQQFVDHPRAPWQAQRVVQDAASIIKVAIEIATFTDKGGWPEATKPDLHIHQRVLEEAIDHALHNNYRKGINAEKRRNSSAIRAAVATAESPTRVATLLQQFASTYDSHGESTEANVLRDAADLVDQLATQPKGTSDE